ncbi:hypothetical protein [Kocuria sabuli]|uniref:hypothetical protein n=1 Tax=Kocuria sabuli TaxID=3071448 RepID=UPI0034D5A0FA
MHTTTHLSAQADVRARRHGPLLALALAMAVLALVSTVGVLLDPRELLGAPVWAKPLKFSLSVLIYAVSLAWLLPLLERGRRLAWWAGTATAVLLGVEMVIIVGTAAAGVRSHFNVSSPLATALWSAMGTSIAGAWVAALLVAALLFRARLGDRGRTLAVRAGLLIALLGMALGFLMTVPTDQQLAGFEGVAGAHTVGGPDGGPGLPLVGWSTEAGDLRIPHFVGMHALQVLPLTALLLELAARRVPALRRESTRAGLLRVGAALYLGVLALLTVQALAGQPLLRPSGAVLAAGAVLVVAAAVAAGRVVVLTGRAAGRAPGWTPGSPASPRTAGTRPGP